MNDQPPLMKTQRPRAQVGGSTLKENLVPRSCPACCHITECELLYSINDCNILRCCSCGLGRAEVQAFDPASYYTSDYFSGGKSDGYVDYLGAAPVLRGEFARTLHFVLKLRNFGRLVEVGCAYGYFLQ